MQERCWAIDPILQPPACAYKGCRESETQSSKTCMRTSVGAPLPAAERLRMMPLQVH